MPVHDWTRLDAGIYHDFHNMWLVGLRIALKRVLPAGFSAMTEQRALDYVVDVLTLQDSSANEFHSNGDGSHSVDNAGGGLSVLTAPPKVQFVRSIAQPRVEAPHKWISIRHVSRKRVVAVIEIMSPGNKSSEDRFRAFTAKITEFLEAGVHVLVVDPFPSTKRDPDGIHRAIWGDYAGDFCPPSDKPLTLVSYHAGRDERAYIEPFAVGDILKDMPLFLTNEIYIPVPLESTYMAAFEELEVEYQRTLTAAEA